MAHQSSQNNFNVPFERGGEGRIYDNETFEQDAGRAAALAPYTVVAQKAASRKWVPLTSVDPTLTKGKMVAGAAGTAEAGFQAISDGKFAVSVDGVAMDITSLDFTGIEAPTATNAKLVCGAIGTNIAGFQAVTDGSFTVVVDGVSIVITTLDWSEITALDEIVDPINALAAGRFLAVYDADVDVVTIFSLRKGDVSTMGYLTAGGGGTDVSGAGFLNGLTGTGTLTQGTGDDGTDRNVADVINDAAAGRFFTLYDGARFAFYSPSVGVQSSVSVLSAVSGGGGTDISGAGYLNGLTGTGTATAGTGEDGSSIPSGIYIGESIPAADLVAGDVTGRMVLLGGNVVVDTEQVVLENSLTLNSVVVSRFQTIASVLQDRGIWMQSTVDISSYQA